jgi:hypothetical protein
VSAASFLDAPCALWVDPPAGGEAPAGGVGGTWRVWLIDALVTLAKDGEGFNGKRPNCDAGWQSLLADALGEHGTTFAQAVGVAFGADRDERDRHLLTPDRAQAAGIGRLISALTADQAADARAKAEGDRGLPFTVTGQERDAAARFQAALAKLVGIRRIPLASVARRWEAAAAARVQPPLVTMEDIRALRHSVARLVADPSSRRDWMLDTIEYLDALVIRRQPELW